MNTLNIALASSLHRASVKPLRTVLLGGALLLASTTLARAITCPAAGTPAGAPVAISVANPQYFTYKGVITPFVGISHEYICHISQEPALDAQYCSLASYPGVLTTLKNNQNNIIRLWGIFNHSPGIANSSTHLPFTDEQPFIVSGGKWDLRTINTNYLANLESVVCDAYNKNIVVEMSLLATWDGDWTQGPFHTNNTQSFLDPVSGTTLSPGFAAEKNFISYENTTTKTDTTRAAQIARQAQKDAIAAIVNRLKKYPNVIWEVANEPDFVGSSGATGKSVLDLQKDMVTVIQANDTAHPIMINGHTNDTVTPANSTFAWLVPGAKAASLHYERNSGTNLFGAIEVQQTPSLTVARANMPLAFNENRFVNSTSRTANDIRSEAWEFMLNEGGMFDAYSIDRGAMEAQAVSTQLKALYNFLVAPSIIGGIPTYITDLSTVQQTTCNGASDWCKGIGAYDTAESGTCAAGPHIFWATMKSTTDLALYIHHALQMSGTGGGYIAALCGNGSTNGYQNPSFQYRLPQAGCWAIEWIDPKTGTKISGGLIDRLANTWYSPSSYPFYKHDIVFLASLWRTGSCA